MPSPVLQAAALPVRDGLLCLVTSRSGRRWVIPKGRIEVRQTAADAARTEAWEEAGLLGSLSAEPVGHYEYTKFRWRHRVTVFVLHVETVQDQWPEQGERSREWVTPQEALRRIDEPDLRAIVTTVFAAVPAAG
jgi:8-oxo-dGTP pyrophosphatase MutT (NUDIX family)